MKNLIKNLAIIVAVVALDALVSKTWPPLDGYVVVFALGYCLAALQGTKDDLAEIRERHLKLRKNSTALAVNAERLLTRWEAKQ